MDLIISIEQINESIALMKIQGEINASNYTQVVDKARATFNNPSHNLIIDLSEVTRISSTGQVAIHEIALIYSGVPQNVVENENPDFTHHSNARKHVKLLNPQPEVDQALTQAGLKLFFKVFTDLDSAVKSF
jgi:anti-anti-sigma regulatory factor